MSTILTAAPSTSRPTLRTQIARHPLIAYFTLAFAGTWAFILPFALSDGQNGLGLLPFQSDIAFLIAFVLSALAGPAAAAIAVTAATAGRGGVRRLLRRGVQWRVGLIWHVIAIFSMLAIYLNGYGLFMGLNLPGALVAHPALLLTTFLPQGIAIILTASFAEELGWRGFALPRLQQRFGPLRATAILGALHGLWHLPVFFTPLLGPFSAPGYAGFLVVAIAVTFLYTWVFNHTGGSVLLATLTHGFGNAASSVLTLLIPTTFVVTGWGAPIVNSSWQALNVIIFGGVALLLLLATRGRLGYNPEDNAALLAAARPETPQ